jgi:hypothetical protein
MGHMQPISWYYVACEIILPFPKTYVNALLPFKMAAKLVEKTFTKSLLNILYDIQLISHDT